MVDTETTPKFNPVAFRLSTLFLVMTLIGVAMGLMASYPVIGWPLGIVSIPVFYFAARIVQHRQSMGVDVALLDKVRVFVWTLAVVSALVALLCFSALTFVIGFCGVLASLSFQSGRGIISMITLQVLGLIGLWVSMRLNKKYEDRYHQEIGSDLLARDMSPSGFKKLEQERMEDAEL